MSGTPLVALNEIEQDALTELVNIGVSRAASSLRVMVGHEVLLSVPRVAIVSRREAAAIIGDREMSRLVAVSQTFEGDFSGRVMLIFPETKSLALVRAVTGGQLPLEDIVALEQEALAETGNIILNSCLATMANLLRRSLRTSLPDVMRGDSEELFELSANADADDLVLMLYINFTVDARDITGHIAMLMDLPALRALKELLNDLIAREGAAPPAANHVSD